MISFGLFRVTKARRLLERDGQPVSIGGRAFDILAHLLERSGQVVSKRELLAAAWPNTNVGEGSLRFQIASIRKALDNGGASYIDNVPGRGYCFAGRISKIDENQTSLRLGVQVNQPVCIPPSAHLIGRAETVTEITSLVRSQRLVSIVAACGMGKTSVAIAAARQATEYFKDGVCFVELGHVEDAERTVTTLALALGLSVRSADSLLAIIGFLQTRQMLILIDGCEHVIDPIATLLEQIVAITVAVHILATSREALRIEFEQVFHLGPLASPPLDKKLSAAEILAYPATQLFVARAGYCESHLRRRGIRVNRIYLQ